MPQLIADVTGAAVSAGFVHSCLGKAAGLVADAVRLIRTLITAAPVAGFDETTLRSGPAGEKKYVHGAFTELYSAVLARHPQPGVHEGRRHPAVFRRDRGLRPLPELLQPTWEHIAGHQACAAHYPDTAVMPICRRRLLVTGVTGLPVSA